MLMRLEVEVFLCHPFLQSIRSREYTNAALGLESVSRFAANNTCIAFEPFFHQCGRRNPQFSDFRATIHPVLLRVFQIEKVRGSANMVVVQMSKCRNIEVALVRRFQIFHQNGRQVATSVVLIFWVSGACVVEENLATVVQIDTATISVPKGEKRYFVHACSLERRNRPGIDFYVPPFDFCAVASLERYSNVSTAVLLIVNAVRL